MKLRSQVFPNTDVTFGRIAERTPTNGSKSVLSRAPRRVILVSIGHCELGLAHVRLLEDDRPAGQNRCNIFGSMPTTRSFTVRQERRWHVE